ncbi:hypothetical protein [Arthrobacter sp.]|uniref:hypothetical protein n=1 Tax=Arthrobacter sp. TaxID=1667 RepID=UPI002591209F|nr:hypothetical protein [Arthrobacter sp.]
MISPQTMNSTRPQGGELGRATVRELIVQLALVEDEQRRTLDPGRAAILAGCEAAIVAALHRKGPDCLGRKTQARSAAVHVTDEETPVDK